MRHSIGLTLILLFLSACGGGEPAKTESAETAEQAAATAAETASAETAKSEAQAATGDCQLTLGWESYEPYQFRDLNGDVRGLDVDVVTAIAERVGCKITYQQGEWRELLDGIKSGKLDLIASATRTEDREEYAYFSDPYREEAFSLYVRAGEANKWAAKSIREMVRDKNMRIGLIDGYVYGGVIEDLLGEPELAPHFISASFSESHAANLLDGKIDGLMEDAYVAEAMIQRKNLGDRIERLPFNYHKGDVAIMFSKQSVQPDLVQRFNETIAAMKSDGKLEAISSRYKKK
ncbi:substrate-binding periplasmic protein [Permianibacter aggregans]|uniref:Amino acid ABC transporter substrate-binding protein (PAAT family) n=1 Tax=Permianibacter aggregans TaxID=1510150 RepID=A0A4R6UG72_9GAMM|nr:transporter substrate-binding domain-containing protein [Permianibacter aggregans]QGX40286.1 amino acid ABC transporter substrate-binding protein [Permianibacter aggregans]TDQ44203.1 amino acid ABC transporter substrate-binding protein (PAAT family) [Permianibacter aggregans]